MEEPPMAVSGSSMTPKTTANDLTMSVGANDGTAIATTLHGDMERIAAGTQQQQQHDTHQQHQQLEGKSSPRPYQLELLEHARARNIIAYLDTGAGKTLVSILLMLDHAPRVVEPISPEVVVAFRRRHADNEVLRDLHARRARLERELGDVLLSASAASSAEASAGNANTGLPKSMTNGSTAASLEVEIRQVADSIHRLEATWRSDWPAQPRKVVMLVPTVLLVAQQAAAIVANTDLAVGEFSSDATIAQRIHLDYFEWQCEISKFQVLMMTPQICLNLMRHGLLLLDDISLLIFDECHHAVKNHPYNCIMREFFHRTRKDNPSAQLPKIFGMTASPILARVSTHTASVDKLKELQFNLDCSILTVRNRDEISSFVARAAESIVEYCPAAKDEALAIGRLDVGDEFPTTAALATYHFYVSAIIHMRNEASNQDTMLKLDKMLAAVQEMKDDLGLWAAAQIAEAYALTTVTASRPRGSSRKRKDRESFGNGESLRPETPEAHDVKELHQFTFQADATLRQFPAVNIEPVFDDDDVGGGVVSTTSFHGLAFRKRFEITVKPPRVAVEQLHTSDLTDKVRTVLRHLQRGTASHTHDSFRAMVFVERRLSAKVLAELVNLCSNQMFPHVTSSFITGHGTQASLPAYRTNTSMSSRAQSKVLQRFRTGAVNTLIVTSVAEEGLDIPACNLVIVMDGFKLPASYVQSRGRARNMESEYVVMCERGNAGQLRMVANAKVAEMVTRDACRDLRLTEICYGDRKDVDDAFAENILGTADLDHPIAIKATGATLSVYSALDVLGRYCSALPHDMYTAAGKATFKEVPVEDGGMGFVFDLRLPIGSPLSMFYIRGGRRLTKKLAMQSAAFKACRLLHERGALDDHLFSSTCSTSTTSAIALSHKQPRSKRAKLDAIAIYEDDALRDLDSTLAVDFYPHRIPRAFHRDEWVDVVGAETQLVTSREVLDWIDGKVARPPIPPVGTPVVLYVSYLTFDDTALELAGFDKETNDIRPAFALCTRRPLPTDLPAVQVFLGLDRIPSLVHVSHMEEIRLTQERWEIVRDFHMKLFANVMAMMSQPHDHSKADDGDDDTAGNGDTATRPPSPTATSDTDKNRMYKLLPATIDAANECSINWKLASAVTTTAKRRNYVEYLTTTTGKSVDELPMITQLPRDMVLVPFNRRLYFVQAFSTTLMPDSPFEKDRPVLANQDAPSTYREYAEHKYGIAVRHTTLPLLDVSPAPTIKNQLARGVKSTATDATSAKAKHVHKAIVLVPEVCELLPFDPVTYRLALVIPSVMRHVEMFLLADELRVQMAEPAMPISTVMEACCALGSKEAWNYERFETLGDAILKYACTIELFQKYPGMDEGALSRHRQELVNNRSLFQRALQLDMVGYVFVTPFFPRQWAPPGIRPWRPTRRTETSGHFGDNPLRLSFGHRAISRKMVADVVEALIAAAYTHGGMDAARRFLQYLGVLKQFAIDGNSSAADANTTHSLPETDKPQLPVDLHPLDDVSPTSYDNFLALEEVLQYRFKNRMLLVEAFTHSSYRAATTACYQRLEFLGDAALDWLITRHFYDLYPECNPAQLTDLRQAAVNNESFGRLVVENDLHRYLLFDSPNLGSEINAFVMWYRHDKNGSSVGHLHDDPNDMEMEGPKLLGDIFESLCGALLLDTGFDVDRVWTILRPIFDPFFERHCQLENISKHPMRLFHEYCQKQGIERTEMHFQYKVEGLGAATTIRCEIWVREKCVAVASANSRSAARRLAATEGLAMMRKEGAASV